MTRNSVEKSAMKRAKLNYNIVSPMMNGNRGRKRNKPLILEKRPVGRPLAYREGFDLLCYKLRLLGVSIDNIANICEVGVDDIHLWLKRIPEFKDAWDAGGELADANVARSLYRRAIGYSHPEVKTFYDKDVGVIEHEVIKHYPPDTAAASRWLAIRQKKRWQEVSKTEHTGADGEPLTPPSITVQVVQATKVEK